MSHTQLQDQIDLNHHKRISNLKNICPQPDITRQRTERNLMKKTNVSFNGITDTTGYLFSLAKCFAAVLKNSEYEAYAEDIIAASGFAFRMWVDSKELCPSATSIWQFKKQPLWFGNSGLTCEYVERMWGEDAFEEERRLSAIRLIKESVDRGTAAVAWDISGCEWGIITGYDDDTSCLSTLKINGKEDTVPYEKLGRLDLPILSVLTVSGKREKGTAEIITDTKRLALSHLKGEEWCDNAKGFAAYDALLTFVREKLSADTAWNLEYYLGTYGALKWYAWKFFEKYQEPDLARLYHTVYDAWQEAFDVKRSQDVTSETVRQQILGPLSDAKAAEEEAMKLLLP